MKTILAALLFAVALLAGQPASAEDKTADVTDMQALQKAVQTDKRAFVADTLMLSDAEAKRFWPVYDAYQRNLDATNRRRVVVVEGLVVRDRPLSDLYARNLANELLAADDAELKARKTLQSKLMKTLPPRKAARYLQLESKIRAAHAYTLAASIPLAK